MEYLYSIVFFAVASAVTPGPNTIMAMLSGLNFGILKSLPLLFGLSIGFAVMLFFVGMGLGKMLTLFPQLSLFIKVAGATYIFYLALLIANFNAADREFTHSEPLNFYKGFIFQWINAKAWVVCLAAVSVFSTPGELYFVQITTLSVVFFIVGFPCVVAWGLLGLFLRRHMKNVKYVRRFNITMALLLVASVIPVIRDILQNSGAFIN